MVVEGVYGEFCGGEVVVIKIGERTSISSKSLLFKLTENSDVCTCACRVGLVGLVWGGVFHFNGW